MQLLLLPGSLATAEELWQQCLSGDCTDLVLCCDDGIIKTHKAILVFCLPWLTDTDTDTVIMPGISVEKLKEAIKEFYLTSESKATLRYFGALFESDLQEEIVCDVEVTIDQDTKNGVILGLHQDFHSVVDKNCLEKEFICKIENEDMTINDPFIELEHNGLNNGGMKNLATKVLHNCSVCGEGLTSIKGLKAHMNTHDPNYGNYECTQCKTFFDSKGLLRHHRRVTQHKKLKDPEPKYFPCNTCGKSLSGVGGLREHIKSVHNKTYDKLCPHCDYRASSTKTLKKHIDALHLGITYPCDQCTLVFTQRENLASHIKTIHSGERPFVCEECGFKSKTKSNLESHVSSIHSTSSFPCIICGKIFKNQSYLASHMRGHDESSQFPCQFCDRKFVTRTKLKMHINTHTGETPYKCPHNCGKAFHSSDQLSHHKKQCKELILNK